MRFVRGLRAAKASSVLASALVLGLSFFGFAFAILLQSSPAHAAPSTSTWATSTAIPTANPYSCVTAAGKIFCVGPAAVNDLTYYASAGSTGIGAWASGTAYPISTGFNPVCLTDSSYIYCIGGGTGTTSVYTDTIGASGFGATWTAQVNSYPVGIELNGCVLASGYIYCVGGISGVAGISTTYYATASGGAVGAWTATTAYPLTIFGEGCAALSGYIYCVAGNTSPTLSIAITQNAYRATISASGIGTWSSVSYAPTSTYPVVCTTASSVIYCFGGTGYPNGGNYGVNQNETMITSASAWPYWQSDAGWQQAPTSYGPNGCTNDGTTFFCVGGYSNWNTPTKQATTQYATIPAQPASPTWNSQTTITGGGSIGSSCGLNGGYLYCVQTNGTTRYASASGGVVGAWTKSTAYPVTNLVLNPPECITDSGYIYCVGGGTVLGTANVKAVYVAPVSSTGIGAWTRGPDYPTNIQGNSLVVYNHYLYSIGGQTGACCTNYVGTTYVSQLNSGGVLGSMGPWAMGTTYPITIYDAGVSVVGNTLYVVAGYQSSATATKLVYKATLTTISPLIGSWAPAGNFPVKSDGQNCPYDGTQIVCIGSDYYQDTSNNNARDFHTSLVYGSSDGGTTWTRLANLPFSTAALTSGSCVADSAGYIYCVGGSVWEDNAGNWLWTGLTVSSQPDPPAPTTTTTTSTQPVGYIPPPNTSTTTTTTTGTQQSQINPPPFPNPIPQIQGNVTVPAPIPPTYTATIPAGLFVAALLALLIMLLIIAAVARRRDFETAGEEIKADLQGAGGSLNPDWWAGYDRPARARNKKKK